MRLNKKLAIAAFVLVFLVTIVLLLIWVKDWNLRTIISSIIILASMLGAGGLVAFVAQDFDTGAVAVFREGILCVGTMLVLGLVSLILGQWISNTILWTLFLLALLYFGVKIIILVIAARSQRGK